MTQVSGDWLIALILWFGLLVGLLVEDRGLWWKAAFLAGMAIGVSIDAFVALHYIEPVYRVLGEHLDAMILQGLMCMGVAACFRRYREPINGLLSELLP